MIENLQKEIHESQMAKGVLKSKVDELQKIFSQQEMRVEKVVNGMKYELQTMIQPTKNEILNLQEENKKISADLK